MCECGCSLNLNYQWKLLGEDGFVYLFAIYPSCRDCCAPAGIDIARIRPGDQDVGDDVMSYPDLPVDPIHNIGGIAVLDIEIVRKQVRDALVGTDLKDEGGVIDEDWADVLAEEAVPDLREAVWETRKIAEQGDTF